MIDDNLPSTSKEDENYEYTIEEPDDDDDQEEGQIVLSSELKDYFSRLKDEKLVPITSANGKEIMLYNRADDIRSRIFDVTDDHEEEEEHVDAQVDTEMAEHEDEPMDLG
jgi:hypothetical protein